MKLSTAWLKTPDLARFAWGLLALLAGLGPAPGEAAEARLYGQGRLWQVTRDGLPPNHVLGTMHSSEASVAALPRKVEVALDGSARLVVELVLTPEVTMTMGAAMALDDGRRLRQVIGAERYARVLAAAERYGLGAAQLDGLRPWAMTAMFSLPPAELVRQAQGGAPLDQVLQIRAGQRSLPVIGLEQPAEQIAVFAGLDEAAQIQLLDVTLDSVGEVDQTFEQMKAAYLAGDLDRLHAMAEAQAAGADPALMALFEDRLIDDRNRRMAERMAPHLAQGGTFVAIGALHLSGKAGILNLLAQQGWRVQRVM